MQSFVSRHQHQIQGTLSGFDRLRFVGSLLRLSYVNGLAGFLALLAITGYALVSLAGRLRGSVGVSWRYGVANLSRRRAESLVQIVAFGTGIMVLLLLGLVRNDLANDWKLSLPTDIPNFFFINIPNDQRDAFMSDLTARGALPSRVMPMIRGRLVALNGTPNDRLRFRREDGEEFAGREQNLTWADELGPDNRIVEGQWFAPGVKGQHLVSIATEFQESMGLKLGDKMTFDIAGETVEATIANFRKVKWDSFQPNFFIVFAPGVIDNTAGTYMTSVHFPSGEAKSLASLARKYPSVSIFDIQDLLAPLLGEGKPASIIETLCFDEPLLHLLDAGSELRTDGFVVIIGLLKTGEKDDGPLAARVVTLVENYAKGVFGVSVTAFGDALLRELAARIAEAFVADTGHVARARFFHRKIRRTEGRPKPSICGFALPPADCLFVAR